MATLGEKNLVKGASWFAVTLNKRFKYVFYTYIVRSIIIDDMNFSGRKIFKMAMAHEVSALDSIKFGFVQKFTRIHSANDLKAIDQ